MSRRELTNGFVMQALVEAANEAILAVDQVALAQCVALKNPEEGVDAAKKKKEMNDVKAGLVDALEKKCRGLLAALVKVVHVTLCLCLPGQSVDTLADGLTVETDEQYVGFGESPNHEV